MHAGAGWRSDSSLVLDAPVSTRSVTVPRVRARYLLVGFVALLLLVSTGVTLYSSYLAVSVPQQLDEGEPLIYGLAARIVQHQSLYQPIDRQPFVQAHYTPVYYYAVAALRRYVGPGFTPGRVLSILAGLAATALLAYLAIKRARSWWVGGLAAVLFLGLGFPGGPAPFMALVRADMLGVAIAVAVIATLAHGTSRLHLVIAAVLAAAAIMTKQSLFGAAVAGTLWLATFNVRKAGLFAVLTTAAVLLPAAVLQWTSGGAFWHNVGPDNPSPTAIEFGAYLFREMFAIQGLPLLVAAFYVVANRAWLNQLDRLLLFYWIASALPIIGMFKVGSNHNYWIELAASTAVLAALGVWRAVQYRPAISSMVPLAALAIGLTMLIPARFVEDRDTVWLPLTWTLNMDRYTRLTNETPSFQHIVTDVSGEKGEILAEALDVAVLGNHPVQFEPFAFSMLEAEGRWNSDPLVDDICNGHITLLVLVYPLDADIHPVGLKEFPMWPNSVVTALRQTMVHEQTRDYHFLYRTRPGLTPAAIAECKTAAAAARVVEH